MKQWIEYIGELLPEPEAQQRYEVLLREYHHEMATRMQRPSNVTEFVSSDDNVLDVLVSEGKKQRILLASARQGRTVNIACGTAVSNSLWRYRNSLRRLFSTDERKILACLFMSFWYSEDPDQFLIPTEFSADEITTERLLNRFFGYLPYAGLIRTKSLSDFLND